MVSQHWPLCTLAHGFWQSLRNIFRSHQALILKNLTLRSQLALFEQQVLTGKRPKPQPTPAFRLL